MRVNRRGQIFKFIWNYPTMDLSLNIPYKDNLYLTPLHADSTSLLDLFIFLLDSHYSAILIMHNFLFLDALLDKYCRT